MKGSAGIIILNELLPKDVQFNPEQVVDSKVFKKHMVEFAKKYPHKFGSTISKIDKLGEKIGIELGANIGPDDLLTNTSDNKKLIRSIEKKMEKAKTDSQKRAILLRGMADGVKLATRPGNDNNSLLQQVRSGSRGKPFQYAKLAVGPIFSVGMDQKPKPILIKNNFTNGLGSNEYFNISSEGRFSSVVSANSTSEPGALSKIIVANTDHIIISMEDCGTKNGLRNLKTDRHVLGRFTAGIMGGPPKLVDENFLRNYKDKYIWTRSPITCKAPKGICVKCYGLNPNGKLVSVGDNVGITASQTIGEIITQMTISTKHSAAGKSDDTKLTGVEGFKILANSPSSFTDKAIIAPVDGRVNSIDMAPQGGHNIVIGTTKMYVPPTKKVLVRVGQTVHAGDSLSSGVVTPGQLLLHVGVLGAQKKEADMLHKLFIDSTNQDLQKKHFEIIARGHLDLGRTSLGKIDSYSYLMKKYPKRFSMAIVNDRIKGKYLAEDIGSLSKGLKINKRILDILLKWKIRQVPVTDEVPSVRPIFKSLEQKPIFVGNLFSKMNYRNISKAIKEDITQVKVNNMDEASDRAKFTGNFL